MQVSKRRKKILDVLFRKGPLSYKEILDEISVTGAHEIDILSDLDTLVFFKFLQHAKSHRKQELESTTQLILRPRTKTQMENNRPRIDSRLEKIKHEVPSWYRKLAILSILHKRQNADSRKILGILDATIPYVKWHLQLVEMSLSILENCSYVSRMNRKPDRFSLTSRGKELLAESSLNKFLILRSLIDEYTHELRIFTILDIVAKHEEISQEVKPSKIFYILQTRYGIRGNKKRAIKNTLENMIFSGLLRVSEEKQDLWGANFTLGATGKHLIEADPQKKLDYFKYDVAISFAGEDRKIARNLAEALDKKGLRVFFDEFFKDELWGKNLTTIFSEAYGRKTRFVVPLVSEHYTIKDWTNFEFSIMKDEEKRRKTEFILPIRIDDTKVVGIPYYVMYLDYRKEGIDGIVHCLLRKLSKTQ